MKILLLVVTTLFLLYTTHTAQARYYPDKGIHILTPDEEILGAEHICLIQYRVPYKEKKLDRDALVNTLADKAKSLGGNVIKALSLKGLAGKKKGYLCFAVVMKVPDPNNVTIAPLKQFYDSIANNLIEDTSTQSLVVYFTSPLDKVLGDDYKIVLTIEKTHKCIFEKNTVCSYIIEHKEGTKGGAMFYFMVFATDLKRGEHDIIEVHYKDGYHICKEYQRLNSLERRENRRL